MNILFKADRELYKQPSSSSGSRTFQPFFLNPRTPYTHPQQYHDSQGVDYTSQQSPLPSPAFTYGGSSIYSTSSDITQGDSSLQHQLLDIIPDRELQDL